MEVPRAQLRVFSPLESFAPRDRERWRTYVDAGGGLTRRQVADVESGAARARLLTGRTPYGPDAALVRRMGERVLLCPLQLELRASLALEEFRRTVPDAAYAAFLPRGDAGTGGTSTTRVPHILDAPWVVPLHWFVAFGPDERRLHDAPEGAGPSLRYLSSVERATSRLAHVIEVVEERTEDGEDILAVLADLAVWLDAFDATSLLELDYAGVGRAMTAQELRDDTTCADLWEAVAGLEAGDGLAVAAAYSVAVGRWRRLQAAQHAS
jgi:hypothetical protein